MFGLNILTGILLVPVVGGTVYSLLTLGAALVYFRRTNKENSSDHSTSPTPSKVSIPSAALPPVTVLRPVCGLEKNLKENLRSICEQNYPEYQVVFSIQRAEDPAVIILRELQQEFGHTLVSVVIKDVRHGSNGKVNNLLGGLTEARYEMLVICDSDVIVPKDYLRNMVAPFSSPSVGLACSLHKSVSADRFGEKLEALSINADYMPSVIFTYLTGAARFCLGPSLAIRRNTLQALGGLEDLADYLAEDNELGQRVWRLGKRVALSNQVVDTVVDIDTFKSWWTHQLYWDLNLRAANPAGFFGTVLVRALPFAFLFSLVRLADPFSLAILVGTITIRLLSAALLLGYGFRDSQGLRFLYLLPLRDLLGFATWAAAYVKKTVVWRDKTYQLGKGGKMILLKQNTQFDNKPENEHVLMR